MERGLDRFKIETAAELGIPNYDMIDKGLLPSRVNGMVGGMMVRGMIRLAESVLTDGVVDTNVLRDSVTQDDRSRVEETFRQMLKLQQIPHTEPKIVVPQTYQIPEVIEHQYAH